MRDSCEGHHLCEKIKQIIKVSILTYCFSVSIISMIPWITFFIPVPAQVGNN